MKQSYFDDMSPHCDLDLKHCKEIFSHDIPANNDASPYQV